MKTPKFNRRQFMKGVGQAGLALPFLESLASKAQAADPVAPRVILLTTYQGHYFDLFYPAPPAGAYQTVSDAYGSAKYAPLSSLVPSAASTASLSPVMGSVFNRVAAKMNVIKGLDLASPNEHNNTAASCAVGGTTSVPLYSFDTILSQSRTFYPADPYKKAIRLLPEVGGPPYAYTGGVQYAFSYDTVGTRVDRNYGLGGAPSLFAELFGTGSPVNGTPASDPFFNRRTALNAVINSLTGLGTNPRLSAADQLKVQGHAGLLNQIMGGLVAQNAVTCTKPATPASSTGSSGAGAGARYDLCFDLLTAGMNCQLTRAVSFGMIDISDDGSLGFFDPYHNNTFHSVFTMPSPLSGTPTETNAVRYLAWNKWLMSRIAYFVNQMDGIVEANGKTMLDNSLVIYIPEFGDGRSHGLNNIPVMTFGGMGGLMSTGNLIDYQLPTGTLITGEAGMNVCRTGRLLNNFWVTVFNKLGIPAAEYERGGSVGFGDYSTIATNWSAFNSAAAKRASLPIL